MRRRDGKVEVAVASGDNVVLFRAKQGAGVVAFGKAIEMAPDGPTTLARFSARFHDVFLGSPVSLLGKTRHQIGGKALECAERGAPVSISDAELEHLVSAARAPRVAPWPASWEIQPGTALWRKELHRYFGGNALGKISRSGRTPNIFMFLGAGNLADRAPDVWDEHQRMLQVVGHKKTRWEPQDNQAIGSHLATGRALRLFKQHKNGACTYLGEFVLDQEEPVSHRLELGTEQVRYRFELEEKTVEADAPVFQLRPVDDRYFLDPLTDSKFKPSAVTELSLHHIDATTPRSRQPEQPRSGQAPTGTPPEWMTGILAALKERPDLADLDSATALARAIQYHRRSGIVAKLEALIGDPATPERELQKILQEETWIFGGDFLPAPGRRTLVSDKQLDITLIRGDGTFHGVELKRANIDQLIREDGTHRSPGLPVHLATCQAMNYLRALDEERNSILATHHMDARRAAMTVVIGHPVFNRPHLPEKVVNEVLRTYNAMITRIEVITYKQLIDQARRTLELAHTDDIS